MIYLISSKMTAEKMIVKITVKVVVVKMILAFNKQVIIDIFYLMVKK